MSVVIHSPNSAFIILRRLRQRAVREGSVVTLNPPPANPSCDGQRQPAWTQPVGWDASVEHGGAGAWANDDRAG